MNATIRLRQTNWGAMQHYRNRMPPWIKVHCGLLEDARFLVLPVATKGVAIMLWLLAGRQSQGMLISHPDDLARRVGMPTEAFMQAVQELVAMGFFVLNPAWHHPETVPAQPEATAELQADQPEASEAEALPPEVALVLDKPTGPVEPTAPTLPIPPRWHMAFSQTAWLPGEASSHRLPPDDFVAYRPAHWPRPQAFCGLALVQRPASGAQRAKVLRTNAGLGASAAGPPIAETG